ncbi:hypothetical protein COL154_005453 [Colletotrichum chrysophilum]|uniref:uncharacterized protein n=1 Tax=Colletotrichum chrysophilum TaxID=1836956 RepID=UPI002300B4F7|nr:uncharacterized protein COL26b_004099 [Colletotrichum chrysophilum]KAJ0363596.1 hypothetical protein COL154_005453 [Colletotrichum chrysophilum]KAJ0377628.1 hypothetical protein COL26b_004099 [Colletotrichum chrysophilum]
MSLHYPELDELKTLKVFRLHIDLIEQRFKKQGRTITFDISSIEDFASQHYADQPYNRWNGRQIRNACHTALALAEFDAQKNGSEISLEIDKSATVSLQLKYFKVVQKAYLDFGEYLADIQGTEGDDRAFQQRLRARKNTPFEKQSLFDARPGPGQRRRPRHANSRFIATRDNILAQLAHKRKATGTQLRITKPQVVASEIMGTHRRMINRCTANRLRRILDSRWRVSKLLCTNRRRLDCSLHILERLIYAQV